MKILTICVLLSLFCNCTSKPEYSKFKNKERYLLKAGETFELYFSTNSCCRYCIYKPGELRNVSFVEEKIIDKGPKDCEGCNRIYAFVFKAEAPGIDTVQMKNVQASKSCEEDSVDWEQYFIEIR